MKLIVVYAIAFLLGFIGFVIAFAPASIVWQLVSTDVERQLPDLQIISIHGTLWSGNADVRYWNFPPTTVRWSVAPAALIHTRLDIRAVASGDNIHLDVKGGATLEHFSADATGYIGSAWINPVSTNYGLGYTGRLKIDRLHMAADPRWFTAAAGNLHWNGGQVIYHTARGPQTINLPRLDGKLYERNNALHLDISDAGQPLITVRLRRSGWLKVNIKTRLMRVADLSWPGGEAQGATALSFEEQIFPAR